jgi:hypothetical protein
MNVCIAIFWGNNYGRRIMAVCDARKLAVAAAQQFMSGCRAEQWKPSPNCEDQWENSLRDLVYIQEMPLLSEGSTTARIEELEAENKRLRVLMASAEYALSIHGP